MGSSPGSRLGQLLRFSGTAHVLALASGLVLGSCTAGFFIAPVGDVSPPARWGHHILLTTLMVAVVVLATVRHKNVVSERTLSG